MTSPLEGLIAQKIGAGMAKIFYDAVLTRTSLGPSLSPGEPGTETETEYACKGIVENYSDYAIANSLVDAQDRKILILATSLAIEPTDGDEVTIRGETYRVLPPVKTDPAKAVWELRGRK